MIENNISRVLVFLFFIFTYLILYSKIGDFTLILLKSYKKKRILSECIWFKVHVGQKTYCFLRQSICIVFQYTMTTNKNKIVSALL